MKPFSDSRRPCASRISLLVSLPQRCLTAPFMRFQLPETLFQALVRSVSLAGAGSAAGGAAAGGAAGAGGVGAGPAGGCWACAPVPAIRKADRAAARIRDFTIDASRSISERASV